MKTHVALLFLTFATCFHAMDRVLVAQEVSVQVATQEPPHYVGVPAVVQLTVDGLEARPEPECTVESDSPDVRVRLSGISPRIVQQMFQSGNQIRRVQQVTFTVRFAVTASRAGEHEIGPFKISQNGTEKRVDAIKMSFQEVPVTDEMRIKWSMPATAYPDQRVPVTIEWWFAGELGNVRELNIDATNLDDFLFAPDPEPQRGASKLPILTGQGAIALAASTRSETIDDKRFTVVTAERTLIPNRPGRYDLPPMTATVELVTEWQRRRRSPFDDMGLGGSLFEEAFGGGRRPAKVELYRAEGEPLTFEVKPFPTQGRPESFAGAVGKGFSLDVTADRTVVRVGDPIRLTIKLRGDGNIEGATLPALSADGEGLDPDRFRLPQGDVAGRLLEGQDAKQFVVSVRVLDEEIDEIPAIAYSWFDTDKEVYRTTRSKPIALRAMPAQVVGADAVVSNQPPDSSSLAPASTTGQPARPRDSKSLTLSGADLAIETNPSRLLIGSTDWLSRPAFQYAGYALGSLCLVVALVDRRRRQIDPAVRKAMTVFREQRNRITSASQLPAKEAAKQIADALQTVVIASPDAERGTIRRVIADCETIAYRPSDDRGKMDEDLIERALDAMNEFKPEIGAN